ncbi:hypothetical protein E2C01_041910 [Portunus trituberculatus]|uniref:Uncharacterized protein n=1 Tax=Portunus trituberculatus TaxID=210409 RepID=A0A5B7FV04_PORTR|nr:hypothetical protein [Portunus trituberculatus]
MMKHVRHSLPDACLGTYNTLNLSGGSWKEPSLPLPSSMTSTSSSSSSSVHTSSLLPGTTHTSSLLPGAAHAHHYLPQPLWNLAY